MKLHSYSQIFALGHRQINGILDGEVVVEEKVDGSQFSMGRIDGQLNVRSKGAELYTDNPEKMFAKAVEAAASLDLHEGWTYRCEYLQSPSHNTLTYDRTPVKHVILFDVDTGGENYLNPSAKADEAKRLGIEVVPLLFQGKLESFEQVMVFLDRISHLGKSKIEGVVIKNYAKFTDDKKVMMAKVVCDEFKEKHQLQWKKSNPTNGDVVQFIIQSLKTEARWEKAVQHLRDAGKLTGTMVDIGALHKEVHDDIRKEEAEQIAEVLFNHAIGNILRGATSGLPEWYKAKLAKSAFPSEAKS